MSSAKAKEKIYEILFNMIKQVRDGIDDSEDQETLTTGEVETDHD